MVQRVFWSMKNKYCFWILFGILLLSGITGFGRGNKFVYTQLKHDGAWDPYPLVHQNVLDMVKRMTNIPFQEERSIVTLSDPELFKSPFIIMKGNSRVKFSPKEKENLKTYINRGGFLFIDDTLAEPEGEFSQSIRLLLKELFPNHSFQLLSKDHALYRAFFLLRNVAGRRISKKYLEGLDVGGQGGGEGRTAIVYCPNDLLGAWMKDRLGKYAFSCEPGGEKQRWESFKLTLNVIYFSLTGTYKRDAVHQPFIERKLGL